MHGVLFTTLILPFILGISGYNESLGLSQRCKDRCDKHRSRGWTGSYFFSCEAVSKNLDEKSKCQEDCDECPDSVCNREKWGEKTFKCPKTQLLTYPYCKSLCHENRPRGTMNGYVLNCEEVYQHNPQGLKLCRSRCEYNCPKFICNKDKDNILFCPTGEFSEEFPECWKDCEDYRDDLVQDRAYTFQCSIKANHSESDKIKCLENCKKCPASVCHLSDPNTRHCPSNYPPRPLPTTPRTTPRPDLPYDGPCKRRCDKYRLGGIAAYSFTCDALFQSPQDFSDCLSDCLLCPSKVCTFEDSSPKFSCPCADNAEDVMLPPEHMSPLCVFFLVSSLLFVLCFFSGGGVLLYKRRIHFEKKRREIKRRFSKRVSFVDPKQDKLLQVPKEPEPFSSLSSASTFDLSPSAQSESESSLA